MCFILTERTNKQKRAKTDEYCYFVIISQLHQRDPISVRDAIEYRIVYIRDDIFSPKPII